MYARLAPRRGIFWFVTQALKRQIGPLFSKGSIKAAAHDDVPFVERRSDGSERRFYTNQELYDLMDPLKEAHMQVGVEYFSAIRSVPYVKSFPSSESHGSRLTNAPSWCIGSECKIEGTLQ